MRMGNRIKVPLESVRPGMFVEDVLNEKGILLFSANTLIAGFHQIDALRRQGVSYVDIDLNKSPNKELSGIVEPQFPVSEQKLKLQLDITEIKKARSIRSKTVAAVNEMMASARSGRLFSIKSITSAVEALVEEVIVNPDIFIGLCQLKSHSDRLYTHSVNVSVLMAGLASALGYSKERILQAGIGGILHDIGKVRLSERLTSKKGVYTRQEMELIRMHPQFGLEIIQQCNRDIPDRSRMVIAQHHERINGSGFPKQLKGERIEEMAQICAIADTYDQLTTESPIRSACLPQEALALIFQGSDEEYPRRFVEHFTKLLGIYPVGSFVKLESGEMGVVVKINRKSLLLPKVMILFQADGRLISVPYIRDLSDPEQEKERDLWKINCSLDPVKFGIQPTSVLMREFSISER